jgi:hypothetical protein
MLEALTPQNLVIHRPFAESIQIERNGAAMLARAEEFLREHGFPLLGGSAAGAWTFTNSGRASLLNGTFDIDSDSYKMALFLSTSNIGATSTTFAGLTNEHAAANGYTAGGVAVTFSLSGTTTETADCTDASWTASGGSIVARFAVIYEVSGNVLCYCLLDSAPADVTTTTGNTMSVQINASGVFTLA